MKYLLLLLLIASSLSARTMTDGNELSITGRLDQTSWYKLPFWSSNGYPKYSGALGTYTAKHIPIAINDGSKDLYVYSQNHTGNLDIFVADSLGNKTLVHTTVGVTDPHDNAVINLINDYVYIIVAARGSKRIGYIYKSVNKKDISEFELISSGWFAYPQFWSTSLLYTKYNEFNERELWASGLHCNQKLVEEGHYAVSYYDGDWIHMAYNYHTNGDLDQRQHIFYMKSKDGCAWYNKDNEALSLPLMGYDLDTLIYDSGSEFVYMKDIHVVDGEIKILTVDSTSYLPDYGTRAAYITDLDGYSTKLANVSHNYNTGGFVDGYVIFPTTGLFGYAGGDIEVFKMDGERVLDAGFNYKYNYCRKVINGSGCYVSEAPSSITNQGAYIRKITIE
jgi:hypothetical protein